MYDHTLEKYFRPYRKDIIQEGKMTMSSGKKVKILNADTIASGLGSKQVVNRVRKHLKTYGNTHGNSRLAELTTKSYEEAKLTIKNHFNAKGTDILLASGSGMTDVVNKIQRIMGYRLPEMLMKQIINQLCLHSPHNTPNDKIFCNKAIKEKLMGWLYPRKEERPVVFVSHMEHHSNHISWRESLVDVVEVAPSSIGQFSMAHLQELLDKYQHRRCKIGAFTACSNVTGIGTPIHQIAKKLHAYSGLCFIDATASAPYENIQIHTDDPLESLDGLYFSPHKFHGGPGSCGIGIFNPQLFSNTCPDRTGGGTVEWTNPWEGHRYIEDIEAKEDGGTPNIIGLLIAAEAIRIKESMGIDHIRARKNYLTDLAFTELELNPQVHILDSHIKERLGIISFYATYEDGRPIHHNLMVKLLSDRYGIQTRGGCSCAGPYGHYLLGVSKEESHRITDRIDEGDLSRKPGWVRISIRPTMTNKQVGYICNSITEVLKNIEELEQNYVYTNRNDFIYIKDRPSFFPSLDWYPLKNIFNIELE